MSDYLGLVEASHLFTEIVALRYNRGKGFFSRKLNPLDVIDIVHGGMVAPKGIDVQQVITIAKEACAVIKVINDSVCPFINGA